MDLWSRLAALLMTLIDRYDEPAVALLIFLDESGLPSPVPGDLIMAIAGYRVGQGEMNLVLTLVLLELASVCGTSVQYWFGARGGRPLLERNRRFLPISPRQFERLERYLVRHGFVTICVARLIPLVRGWTPMLSGALGVPYRTFIAAIAIGGFAYVLFLVLLGMWVGPEVVRSVGGLQLSIRAVLTVVAFVALCALLVYLNRRRAARVRLTAHPHPEVGRVETAALAGFLATVVMSSGVNGALYLLSAVGLLHPHRALVDLVILASGRFAGESVSNFVMVGLVLLLLLHVGWAVLYARLGARLPGALWVRGLLFAALPLAFSLFVLLPALGGGVLGLKLGAGALPLVGELFRNALFGLALAATYALLRDAIDPLPADPTLTPIPPPDLTPAPSGNAVPRSP